ncbi:MAG: hypothetical protein HPY65_18940 [Syntrophaceae bacterium]|nr:hypothetical protein [Syntrophaceae bacterium]
MQLPKSQFISFKKATSIIPNCDLEDLEYCVQQGALAVFAPTPTYFPTNNIFSDEERIFESFYTIAMFFNEPLSDRCQIKLPFSHHNGSVTCGAIVVTDISGNVPTTKKDITLSKTDGCIGPDGEIRLLSRTWSFSEDDLLLSREELKQYEGTASDDAHKAEDALERRQFNLSNYIEGERNKGVRTEVIAYTLFTDFNQTYVKIALAFKLNAGLCPEQHEALKGRGRRLVEGGKKIVLERKN